MPKHLVIVAGEESGDCHAASLVRELRLAHPTLKISGIGGKHMEQSGVELISDLARHGVTGIAEVIRHLRVIKKAFSTIKKHLTENRPDLVILVDYPGFNLRLAKFAKESLGLRIVYYVSPQIWAWKAKRINTIRAYIDKMAVILPFEKKIYEDAGVPVAFVGHPILNKLPADKGMHYYRDLLNLTQSKKIIALLPGSRRNEIEKHLPVMIKTAEKLAVELPNVHFVLPIAHSLNPATVKAYFKNPSFSISFIEGKALNVIASADCVVVASGTASLECALLIKPMCIIYKASFLTYIAAFKLLKVHYLGLCNLLQNRMIVPELLQYDCNAHELSRMVKELLTNTETINHMQKSLLALKHSLSAEAADSSLCSLIEKELNLCASS